MPHYSLTERFRKDFNDLDLDDQERFRSTIAEEFIPDLAAGHFRPGLRVKGVQGAQGVFEMTWAPDGRATWQYGDQLIADEPHIIWRRVGTHDIFRMP
jgi:hypothetical protein